MARSLRSEKRQHSPRCGRTTNINGKAIASSCAPYSLYVQLPRCRSLDGMMLLSKAREADVVGNKVPEAMEAAEERLGALSKATIREAESWGWADEIMR